ncbi:hypothetical protein V1498_22025 [Peribacillus sp. SCS-26]|uniref:hypothetical protein n=1 Tax=Paraperibacillus marinus TaxID=3115295 RepID=UPI0039066153
MSSCNLDHSREDVLHKLSQQDEFLPHGLTGEIESFLGEEQSQETLNEVFHLLKKYDLSSTEERESRNERLEALLVKG